MFNTLHKAMIIRSTSKFIENRYSIIEFHLAFRNSVDYTPLVSRVRIANVPVVADLHTKL